jgi:lysophospholipase L1-like esterase
MKEERRVVGFIAWSTGILLVSSLLALVFGISWKPFDRINLLSDVMRRDSSLVKTDLKTDVKDSAGTVLATVRSFDRYQTPGRIIGFRADSNQHSLSHFLAKLHRLKTTKKGKVRIAYFGDSMIEGDLITQTLRQLMQKQFGGAGVGYIPITSIVAGFRQTVRADYSRGWIDRSFKSNPDQLSLYLSGHAFQSQSDWARFTDATTADSNRTLEKILLCGPAESASISVNDQPQDLSLTQPFNRIVLRTDAGRTLKIVANSQTPVLYGVSFEAPDGIVVDNFSFRGITGIELAKLSVKWLQTIQQQQPYDLIVFQYGVNLLFRPMDKDFRWYGRAMQPVVERFKQCFPAADVLLVSTADRAFRYQGKYASAVGIDSLVRVQAKTAFDANIAFYNQFATMGGTNSIVEWANRTPAWAGRDHVHPNARGAAWLGEVLYNALLHEYALYQRTLK